MSNIIATSSHRRCFPYGQPYSELDQLRSQLRIGLQWKTKVTRSKTRHCLSQAYCSALPVADSNLNLSLWEPFAKLILEASSEATFSAACLYCHRTGNRQIFLTLIGGGVFGNHMDWITSAIGRALGLHAMSGLDVAIVSFRKSNPALAPLIAERI